MSYDCAIKSHGRGTVEVYFSSPAKYISKGHFLGSLYLPTYNGRDFSIPIHESASLIRYALKHHRDWTFQIDPDVKEYAERIMKREHGLLLVSTAKDADIPNCLTTSDFTPLQRANIAFQEYGNYSKLSSLVTGAGKTIVALGYAKRNNFRSLVIAPAKLLDHWQFSIKKFLGLESVKLSGRVPSLSDVEALKNPRIRFFLLPYEVIGTEYELENEDEDSILSRPWVILLNLMADLNLLDLVIADEAHQFGNLETKRARTMLALKIKHRLPMTATPITNNGLDLYPLLAFCDPESFPDSKAFLRAYYDNNGKSVKNEEALQSMLSMYMFRRNHDDLFGKDTHPIERHRKIVPLLSPHLERAKLIEQGIYADLKLDPKRLLSSILPKLNAYRQIVGRAKADFTIEEARSAIAAGKKIVVFAWFKEDVEHIARALNCSYIHGDIQMGLRDVFTEDFQTNASTRSLVCSVKTAQEGLTLTEGYEIICNDICWTAKDHTQMEGRCFKRTNNPHGGKNTLMVTDSSIDRLMSEIVQYKLDLTDASIDGTKDYQELNVSIVQELISRLKTL